MPFADTGRAVTDPFKKLGEGYCVFEERLARMNRVRDPIAEFVHASEKCRARGRTRGAHVKVLKPDTFVMEVLPECLSPVLCPLCSHRSVCPLRS